MRDFLEIPHFAREEHAARRQSRGCDNTIREFQSIGTALRYMYRKALVNDDWSKEGRPSEMWDDKTMPPMANWHRFDAVDSSYAIA
jgi:hypothetical protein